MTVPRPLLLLSLPRSGSTLLQRLLATHPRIETASEPWLLLPLMYALRENGLRAEYDAAVGRVALEDLCARLPGGKSEYLAEAGEFALRLYSRLCTADTDYFLDKTPRYHLVARDLLQVFPQGRFVFLWRNPLAIAASVFKTWNKDRLSPSMFELDLYSGLANLVDAYDPNDERMLAVRYEDLVHDPEEQCARLFRFLELEYAGGASAAFGQVELAGSLGDPTPTGSRSTVANDTTDAWVDSVANPIRRGWYRKYLRWIGRERLNSMGYDFDILEGQVSDSPRRMKSMLSDALWLSGGRWFDIRS